MDPPPFDTQGQAPGNAIDLTEDDNEVVLSEDEDLRTAISLSLHQDGDSDDEDLKAAIALSLQSGGESSRDLENLGTTTSKTPATQAKSKPTESPTIASGIPGLDRRRDEAARLERLKRKRESSISPPPLGRRPPSPTRQPLDKVRTFTSSSSSAATTQLSTKAESTDESNLQYPDGVIKKTWAFGYPRANDIKFEEVVQPHALQAAVLSSFQWNMEWLFSKFDTARTKFVLVMQAKTQETREQYRSETATMKNLRLCFPPMDGQIFCMHSKLMLLFYGNRLRIVVPTANLTDYDWGEMGGVMENSCFLIDLPKLPVEVSESKDLPSTGFRESLLHFLDAQDMQKDVIEKVKLFDFRKTSQLAFVHAIGGSHSEEDWKRTGLCGLGAAIKSLGLVTSLPIAVDYIASSIGSLNDDFLRSLYLAAQGDDGLAALQLTNKIPKDSTVHASRQISNDDSNQWQDNLRVYFPSTQTVQSSKGGPDCAGTICFQKKWYNSQFPKAIMRDCVSVRSGLLMHNKIMYVRLPERVQMRNEHFCRSWVYVGSANVSESAWGKLVYTKKTKQLKLNVRNWECGVVLPVQERAKERSCDEELSIAGGTLGKLADAVPIPIKLPGEPYGSNSPWFSL